MSVCWILNVCLIEVQLQGFKWSVGTARHNQVLTEPQNTSLSHSSYDLQFSCTTHVNLFPSLLTFTFLPYCVSSKWVGESGTQRRSEERWLHKNTEFGLSLISSGKSAVTTPPAYKCTCRAQSLDYCTMSLCFISACHVLLSPALCPAVTSLDNLDSMEKSCFESVTLSYGAAVIKVTMLYSVDYWTITFQMTKYMM